MEIFHPHGLYYCTVPRISSCVYLYGTAHTIKVMGRVTVFFFFPERDVYRCIVRDVMLPTVKLLTVREITDREIMLVLYARFMLRVKIIRLYKAFDSFI